MGLAPRSDQPMPVMLLFLKCMIAKHNIDDDDSDNNSNNNNKNDSNIVSTMTTTRMTIVLITLRIAMIQYVIILYSTNYTLLYHTCKDHMGVSINGGYP